MDAHSSSSPPPPEQAQRREDAERAEAVTPRVPTARRVGWMERTETLRGFLIGPTFLILAAWFLRGVKSADIPHTEAVRIASQDISTEPMRRVLADPPSIEIGGYRFTCMECHKLFPPSGARPRQLTQHTHIRLDHGLNDRCLNCHDEVNRNRLVLTGGDTIPFGDVPRLCAKCHGPTYRDWQRGMHGRTNGYWDPTRGQRRRLVCIECHDPHAPAFGLMRALPGPNTLRMGEPRPAHGQEREAKHNPLRRWSNSHHDRPSSSPSGPEAADTTAQETP